MTWFFLVLVFAATGWISWKVRKRRQETWLQRDRYHQPLPSVAAAQKLGIRRDGNRDDVGLQLRDAVNRKIAELPVRDDDARIAEVERLAREREWR